jgi:hypothetical protein
MPPPGIKNFLIAPVVVAVVVTVTTAVAEAPLILKEGALTEHVGGAVGLTKAVVTEQLSATVPVNPPEGVTVIVDVFPVVAPAATVIPPLLLRAKLAFDTAPTVTTADPVALLYVPELGASGIYSTVSVSLPTASDPPGIVIVAAPALSVSPPDVYPPPLSTTSPVGTGFPLPPFTATVTIRPCVVVILVADGVTATAGVNVARVVTAIVAEPAAPL